MDDREQRIRERAYQIWEEEGRQDGQHSSHWERAEREAGGTEVEQANREATKEFRGSDASTTPEETTIRPPSFISPD